MKLINLLIGLLVIVVLVINQQCTDLSQQRCLCNSATPLCSCSALTPTNNLNFSSSYRSRLIAVSGQGCRPCPSSCLRCTNLTICT